jgi:hypothetical protein
MGAPFFSAEDTGELRRLSEAFREVLCIFYDFIPLSCAHCIDSA